MQKPSRHGQHRVQQHLVSGEHAMQQRAAGAAVAVCEGVDGFELRVEDGRLGDRGDVVSCAKRDEVV